MNPSSPSDSGFSFSLPDEPHLPATTPTNYAQGIPPRRQSSGRSGWDQSPISSHHNQGTSYFPSVHPPNRPTSPTPLPRRLLPSGSSGLPSRFTRSASASSMRNRRSEAGRSASVSSNRLRHDDRAAFSEDEEDELTRTQRQQEEGIADPEEEEENGNTPDAPTEGAALEDLLSESGSVDPVTLRERQSLINVEHPFGLPIWKPALYKKSRTVTRNAETALHSVPSATAEKHLLPGNILWALLFGWWLSLIILLVSCFFWLVELITTCGGHDGFVYSKLIYGLGWYIFWPFGNYLEGDLIEGEDPPVKRRDTLEEEDETEADDELSRHREDSSGSGSGSGTGTIRASSPQISPVSTPLPINEERVAAPLTAQSTITPRTLGISTADQRQHLLSESWSYPVPPVTDSIPSTEHSSLLPSTGNSHVPFKSYGTTSSEPSPITASPPRRASFLATAAYYIALTTLISPIMLFVTILCWGLVITIPMAKLNWALMKFLFFRPQSIRFRAAPLSVFVSTEQTIQGDGETAEVSDQQTRTFTFKSPRLRAGQAAPMHRGVSKPGSTVLLCTYRAVGLQYYKYTVGGVNIMFVNLLPLVFFVIFDAFVLLPLVERRIEHGRPVSAPLAFIAHRAFIFILSLASVIPLSYFIGMAVASISAQSSIGMGAVINATFGSVIEVILYGIALTQGKGRLVEGSIIGSILAGVLLMPGASMCSGALRKKEQKFNAKSAGVTSTMLIMAIIGTLTPTLFYQTYGNFQLICSGCPDGSQSPQDHWMCRHCYYTHPDPVNDPFYQTTVKTLMYFCAGVLLFSYLIGLWFSLRTHASQIWQNPQQLMHPLEAIPVTPHVPPRTSLYNRVVSGQTTPLPTHLTPSHRAVRRRVSNIATHGNIGGGTQQAPQATNTPYLGPQQLNVPSSPNTARRISYANAPQALPITPFQPASQPSSTVPPTAAYTSLLDNVDSVVKNAGIPAMQLPPNLTTEDFTRAVAVATVDALRQQSEPKARSVAAGDGPDDGGHAGHEGPSWSRTTSASVLLACTALYAVIAEILVDVVDVVLEGSAIDEKFLGITLFALVPNTTEFMNAMSFALNGNIALSMEIGSAYALQVCLLQIPTMVAFSAWYDPRHLGEGSDTFTLIFPRWDVIAIILSIFLLTYTYIEAKSNYHRGSILILSYVVLVAGFYFAPHDQENITSAIPFISSFTSPFSFSQFLHVLVPWL